MGIINAFVIKCRYPVPGKFAALTAAAGIFVVRSLVLGTRVPYTVSQHEAFKQLSFGLNSDSEKLSPICTNL